MRKKNKQNPLFLKLEKHIGCAIQCVGYRLEGEETFTNITIECLDCNEVLIDEDEEEYK